MKGQTHNSNIAYNETVIDGSRENVKKNSLNEKDTQIMGDLPRVSPDYKKMQSNYTIRESSGSSRSRVYQNRIQVEVSKQQSKSNSTKHIEAVERQQYSQNNQFVSQKQTSTAYGQFQTISSGPQIQNENSFLKAKHQNKTLQNPANNSVILGGISQPREQQFKQSQFFSSASRQLNLSAIEIENNNRSLSSLLELGENYLEGPDAKGIKKRKGQFQTALQKSRLLKHNHVGQSQTQYGQFQMHRDLQYESSKKSQDNSNGQINSLGKLALKTNIIGVTAIEKDRKDLDSFLFKYQSNTTLADKSRNYQEKQCKGQLIPLEDNHQNLPTSYSFDQRLNLASNKTQQQNPTDKRFTVLNQGDAHNSEDYQAHQNTDNQSNLQHPQIIVTNQRINNQGIEGKSHINTLHRFSFPQQSSSIEDDNNTYNPNYVAIYDSQSQAEAYTNLRAKSQNTNAFTNTGTTRGERNGFTMKSGYSTTNDFNLKRYKQNRSQLATTGQPSTRPIYPNINSNSNQSHTHYGTLDAGKDKRQLKSLGLGVKQNLKSAQNQRSTTGQASKLRFLMEENAIFQEECDAKIDSVINQVLRDQNLHGSQEYQKLLKTIDQINVKLLGEQAKFEMRFNLDLVFSGDRDIQMYSKSQKQENNQSFIEENLIPQNDVLNSQEQQKVDLSRSPVAQSLSREQLFSRSLENLTKEKVNASLTSLKEKEILSTKQLNLPSNPYSQANFKTMQIQSQNELKSVKSLSQQAPQLHQDNLILMMDLIDKLTRLQQLQTDKKSYHQEEIDELFQSFGYHAYEVQKLFRVLFRQINNPQLNQVLQSVSVWTLLWIDQIHAYCEERVQKVQQQSQSQSDYLTLQFEKRWKDLEEKVKKDLVVKEQEVDKLKLSLERLIRDKERVEDTLRHRDSEIQMLNRNPDYDMLKSMLDELANYLDECDERTLELRPQIESIRNISQLVHQLEDEKRIEDLNKKNQPRVIKIRKRKQTVPSEQQNAGKLETNNKLAKDSSQSSLKPANQEERVVVRIQKVYERMPTAGEPQVSQLINSNDLIKSPPKPMTSHVEVRPHLNLLGGNQNKDKIQGFICSKCNRSESESKMLAKLQREKEKQALKNMQKQFKRDNEPVVTRAMGVGIAQMNEQGVQTQLTLIKEPYSSIADQMLGQSKQRRGTIVNNRKVLIMPKEALEAQAKQSALSLSRNMLLGLNTSNQSVGVGASSNQSQSVNQKLGDPAILKLVETAMEEMVRFEVNESSQYYQLQQLNSNYQPHVRKIFEFKEYLFDFLLTQYGLRNIAQRNYDQIMQRIYWYAERDNPYSVQMLNALGNSYPPSGKSWSINKQHLCIFAKIIFSDSQSLMKSGSIRGDVSPVRRMSRIDLNLVGDAFSSGGQVNIFDLLELMSKYSSSQGVNDNPMVIKLLQSLKPGILLDDDVSSIDTDFENESIFLELVQMKITAKLAKFGFDSKYFLDTIDYKDKGRLRFSKMLQSLTDRFNLHFSNGEITALRRYFLQNVLKTQQDGASPKTTSNFYVLIKDSDKQQQPRQSVLTHNSHHAQSLHHTLNGGSSNLEFKDKKEGQQKNRESQSSTSSMSLQSLLFTQNEFMSKVRLYLVSKAQFIQFVLEVYDDYMEQLSSEIEILFKKYDDFYQKGGINQQQFANLIKDDLNIFGGGQGIGMMQSLEDEKQIEKLFKDALEFLEDNEYLKGSKLLGVSAVKEIIMERNLESLPFYTYMRNKFNQGKQFISAGKKYNQYANTQFNNNNITNTNSHNKLFLHQQSQANGSFSEDKTSPLNMSASPMRRGTLRLKRM